MVKAVALLLVMAASSLLLFAQNGGEETAASISKIVALEKAWDQAFKFRDTNALNSLLDDDAVIVNDDGSIQSKREFLAWIGGSRPSEQEQVVPDSISVRVAGDVAVVTGTFEARGVRAGKPYVRRDRFLDTWMRKQGIWLCVSATAIPVLH